MARIGLDASAVQPGGKGIARVQDATARALAALGLPHELVVLVRDPVSQRLFEADGFRCELVPSRLTITWEQIALPRAAARLGLDLVLTTTDRLPIWGRSCRYVVWLYELPTHRIAQNRAAGSSLYQRASDLLTSALWRRSLARAAYVVTGSKATADEVRAMVPSAPVSVVYPGLGPEFSPSEKRGRFVFHLGSSDPRDNTECALEAFAAARARVATDAELVIAGGLGARRAAVEERIRRLGLGDSTRLLGRVSDEELARLYREAAVYLDTTLFEGFGYQVLEAMASGTPVVASATTSIPEILGDAGVLCEPDSTVEFADGLVRVLDDPAFADWCRRRGLERAATFTWDRTARELASTFDEVLRECKLVA
jgi:glycosyltransferase involved in cell wall biosynthesis